MSAVLAIIQKCNSFLWGGPLLLLLMGTHLFFSFYLHFPQGKTWKAVRMSFKGKDADQNNLSVFATLSTTLAATLGTGNIVGVSTAVALGGPGAVFWCWITGVLGMATSYAECYLSVRYRSRDKAGTHAGGPMYVFQNGLHMPLLGSFYAVLTLLAALFVGCTTQSNSMAETGKSSFHLAPSLTGFLAAILAGLVIVGGIRSIGKVCVRLVPVLAILFTSSCLLLLFLNRTCLFPAVALILKDAFTGKAVGSGLSAGSLMNVLRYGIARGLFTNEAGIGTSSIMAAASSEESPSRQAYVSMTAVFWDTVVMCLLSGLVIVTNILKRPQSVLHASQGTLTDAAFSSLPFLGNGFLSVCLIAFALTTLIGWSYLGESAVTYLTGGRGLFLYKVAYIVMIYIGAILPLQTVWECTDLINACMVIPNVLALFLLRREIQIT